MEDEGSPHKGSPDDPYIMGGVDTCECATLNRASREQLLETVAAYRTALEASHQHANELAFRLIGKWATHPN
jgi:hypothetical protein